MVGMAESTIYPFTETCPVCNKKMAEGNVFCSKKCHDAWAVSKDKEEQVD